MQSGGRRAGTVRGVFARLRQRIKNIFTRPPTTTTIPASLQEEMLPRLIKTTVDRYRERIFSQEHSVVQLACKAVVESVTFYRNMDVEFGQGLLICRLRHPSFLRTKIVITLERVAQETSGGPSSSARSSSASVPPVAIDELAVATDKTDVKALIRSDHPIDKRLTFPGQVAPNLVDLLAAASFVTRNYPITHHGSIFYALAIYNALEMKFEGKSDTVSNCTLPFNDEYENDFKTVVDAFNNARAELQAEMYQLQIMAAEKPQFTAAEKLKFLRAENDELRAQIADRDERIAALDVRMAASKAAQGHVDGKLEGVDEEDQRGMQHSSFFRDFSPSSITIYPSSNYYSGLILFMTNPGRFFVSPAAGCM
ncbi:hypothetical protein B0H11DRAFT_2199707 [Mycena galericulata]|nr:hypothetical protein B0H11DRAFT_2199707 [Mycena galericulata]